MKKILLLSSLLFAFLLGCGEAGIETDISKVIEFDVTIDQDAPQITFENQSYLLATHLIDPASDEFSEYSADIKEYIINEIELDIVSIQSNAGIEMQYFGIGEALTPDGGIIANWIATVFQNNLYEALTNNGKLAVVSDLLIYSASKPNEDLTEEFGVINLSHFQEKLSNGQPGRIALYLYDDNLPSEFLINIKIKVDLTARTQLD